MQGVSPKRSSSGTSLPGAQDNLQRATNIVRRMITQYSMSEALGLAAFEEIRPTFLPVPAELKREYSEETSRMIDQEIRKLLAESHARVQETLMAKRTVLDALAALLSEREVVDRAALERITGVEPIPA